MHRGLEMTVDEFVDDIYDLHEITKDTDYIFYLLYL